MTTTLMIGIAILTGWLLIRLSRPSQPRRAEVPVERRSLPSRRR